MMMMMMVGRIMLWTMSFTYKIINLKEYWLRKVVQKIGKNKCKSIYMFYLLFIYEIYYFLSYISMRF